MNKLKLVSLLLCLVLMICTLASCAQTPSEITCEDDLISKKIGVIRGSKSDEYSRKFTENGCEIIGFKSRLDMVKAFDAGEIDCAIMDENHAKEVVRENTNLKVLESVSEQKDSFGFYMLEAKRVYTIMLNKALAELKENGKLDEIVNGYLNDPEYEYDFPESFDTSNGFFKISLDPSLYPYVYAADEDHVMPYGIAIAVIDAVCEHLGCGYELVPVTSNSLNST
ncbi:MAG: transporter substrate-binding domain-containing protein, partial [Clostridia bacterium]|nr:transporter substrate-binding domain-containing protein [Clostridia bacterium]